MKPSGVSGWARLLVRTVSQQGPEVSTTAGDILPCSEFQCDTSHPSLPYRVEARTSDLYTLAGEESITALILSVH